MQTEWKMMLIMIIVLCLVFTICCIYASPFEYPYKYIRIDISGKRKPKTEDLVDRYLIENGVASFIQHYGQVQAWKEESEGYIEKQMLKNWRREQYQSCIDDDNMFVFQFMRRQTRYKQINYVKTSYHVDTVSDEFKTNLSYIQERYKKLEKINFECTLSEFYAKNQRRLMTKELREEIARRDNYTCQICGKYMPDEVGLHIDHIIPVAKGGKSIPSNLQVLCSKCNGRKSSK